MQTARDLIAAVVDAGTWASWDPPAAAPGPSPERDRADRPVGDRADRAADSAGSPGRPDPAYAEALAAARARTGLDEAVLTGQGRLAGRPVAVVATEFGFLGGSIGVAAADRLTRAVERATARRLPLLALTASGGTRMQEGTVAFLQMVKITQAVLAHRAAGLPYLVYLRHPTTGGVFASWGSLGHVTVAEPGALIGFLGPRVYQALHGQPFPPDVQTAENLFRNGLVDAVVPPADFRATARRTLNVLCAPHPGPPATPGPEPDDGPYADVPAWESVRRSRRPDRPGVRLLLRQAARDVVPLNGPGAGTGAGAPAPGLVGRDCLVAGSAALRPLAVPGVLLALARFGAAPAVVVGQDRHAQTSRTPIDQAALRVARRGMRLASELRLPLVTIIDTPGAALTREAEEGGLAGEIARCLADLVTLDAPTLCVLLGQGGGGGALALLPADRVVAAEHGWLSPLPPEGAAAILHRDPGRAAEVADRQGIRSRDLRAAGIADRVVGERPDAAAEPEAFLARLAATIGYELSGLLAADPGTRLAARAARYRRLGC